MAVARLSKVVEDSHNVKIVESLWAKQELEDTSSHAIDECST